MDIFKRVKDKLNKKKNIVAYWSTKGVGIGEGCEIYPSVNFGSEPYLISLGDHVRINSGVQFVTHDGGVWVLRHLKDEYKDIDVFGKITIGNNVHIGTNVIIMPGVNIGNNCIVGCGAIVTKNIPDNSIAVGIPARVIESIDEYERKHVDDFVHTKMLTHEQKKRLLLEMD